MVICGSVAYFALLEHLEPDGNTVAVYQIPTSKQALKFVISSVSWRLKVLLTTRLELYNWKQAEIR